MNLKIKIQALNGIDLNTTTSVITIQILSAYPGEEVNGAEAFPECAIQEITFYGRG